MHYHLYVFKDGNKMTDKVLKTVYYFKSVLYLDLLKK